MSIRTDLERVTPAVWKNETVYIRPIETEQDLIYALFQCRISKEQQELVNPAAFSIGRAYLSKEDNVPCLICNEKEEPVGFMNLCKWLGRGNAYTWSYYIDQNQQGKGYGKSAACLAIRILKEANQNMPVKLAAEKDNRKAQNLYHSLGFEILPEKDGDDLVFGLFFSGTGGILFKK